MAIGLDREIKSSVLAMLRLRQPDNSFGNVQQVVGYVLLKRAEQHESYQPEGRRFEREGSLAHRCYLK